MDSIEKSVGMAKAALGGLAGGLLSGLSVIGLINVARRSIDAADAMNDLSQRVGISIKDLAKYELAASQSGTTMESLAKGIKGLGANLMEHGDALRAAGITAKEADGALKQVADVFARMPDGLEKTNLAVKLFGKSGMEMIPMLNMGSKGLEEAAEKSAKYAAQMAAMAPLSDAFNDNMAELSMHSKTAGMSLMNDLLPGLVLVSKAMADAAKNGGMLDAAVAGIQMLITGDDLHKANVATVKGLELVMAAESALEKARATGDAQRIARLENTVRLRKEEMALHDNYRKMLQEERDGPAKPSVPDKPAVDAMASYKAMMAALGGDAGKAAKEMEKLIATGRDLAASLLQQAAGLSGDFIKKWESLGLAYKKGAISLDDLTKAQAELLQNQPQIKAMHDAEIDAAKEQTKEVDALFDAQEKLRLGNEAQIKTARTMLEQIEFETSLLGMNAQQRSIATMERDLERQGIVKGTQAYDAYIQKLKDATALKGVTEAQIKVADDTSKAWVETAKSIESALYNSLMRGFESGKSMWDSARDYIVNGAKSMVVKILVQPAMGVIGSLFGMGSAMAGTSGGGGGSGAGGGMGILDSVLGNVGGFFGAGGVLSEGISGIGASLINGPLSSVLGDFGATLVSSSSTIAAAVPYIGAAMAGFALLKNVMDYKVDATGNALTATVGSKGVLNGSVGTRADFTQTGGFMGGGVTKNSTWGVADQGTTGYINAVVQNVTASNAAYARILGLNVSALDGYTKALDINITGMDAAAAQTAINTEVQKFGVEQVTAAYGEALAQYAKTGETVSDTLKRLAGIEVASVALNEFGGIFSRIATLGIEGRDSMFALAGGIEAFVKKSSDFVKLYYSADEQSGIQASAVLAQLNAAGVTDAAQLSNKEEFRALVESIDVSNQSGREQLNALLTIAPQFAQVSEYLKTNNIDLGDLAALAPQIAALDPLFQQNNDAATANATAATDATTASINATTDAINENTTAVVAAVNNVATAVAAAVRDGMTAANASSAQVAKVLDSIDSSNRLDLAGG